jgi:amino acid transporter
LSKPKVFAREATGLVREVSAKSSFVAQFFIVTGGYPIFLLTYLSIFSGANFFLAFCIGFPPMFALLVVYALFGISMPRAGGDYIYVSRGLNSFVGFVNAFAMAAGYMVANGLYAIFYPQYLGYQLSTIGIVDRIPSMLSLGSLIIQPLPSFTIALVLGIAGLAMALLRPRYCWAAIFWTGIISLICTAIMFIALALINPATFQASYDSFVTTNGPYLTSLGLTNATTYQQTITAGGWTPPTSVMAATLAAFPIAMYSFTWSMLPANWAGEIKRVQKNLPLTLLGGMLFLFVYYVLLLQLSLNAFGQPFMTSWSALSTNPSYPIELTLSDYIPFFAYLVVHNPIIVWAMFIALWFPAIFSFAPLLIASVRYLFAWSFDRVLPEKISSVNERTHTPIVATVLAFAVMVPGMAIEAFDPAAMPGILVPIFIFGYLLPALTGIVFPFLKKDLYESSFVVKRKVAGIPVLTWAGLVAFIALAIGTYSIFASGLYPMLLPDYVFYGLAYGLGVVIFVVAYVVRKRSGADLLLSFKAIPPE